MRETREALKAIAHLSMPKHQCPGLLHSNRSHIHKMKPSGASPQTEPFIKTDSQMEVPGHQLLTHSLQTSSKSKSRCICLRDRNKSRKRKGHLLAGSLARLPGPYRHTSAAKYWPCSLREPGSTPRHSSTDWFIGWITIGPIGVSVSYAEGQPQLGAHRQEAGRQEQSKRPFPSLWKPSPCQDPQIHGPTLTTVLDCGPTLQLTFCISPWSCNLHLRVAASHSIPLVFY